MHKEVMVMGRLVMQPRLVAYQADDPGLAYTYSRLTLAPDAWSPAVLAIKVRHRRNCVASMACLPHPPLIPRNPKTLNLTWKTRPGVHLLAPDARARRVVAGRAGHQGALV